MVLNPEQAFCTNDNCDVVTFNPSLANGGFSEKNISKWREEVEQDGTHVMKPESITHAEFLDVMAKRRRD